MAMSLHVAMNGSLASRQEFYEQNLDGLLDGASALVRGGYSLGGMATNATTRVAKKNAKVLSDVAQGQVLTNAMHASQPAIKGALSRWLWDLHTENASFPLGGRSDENHGESEPGQSYDALYSLEFLPPDSRYGMPPPDGLLQDMDIQLFDVHRPTNDDSASEGLPNTGSPRLAREDSSNGAGDSVIDREISMVRIVATFASGQHGTGENASAFPGIVVRGRHCWCPSVLVSLRQIQIEVKTRCWWQMQTGLLRLALLGVRRHAHAPLSRVTVVCPCAHVAAAAAAADDDDDASDNTVPGYAAMLYAHRRSYLRSSFVAARAPSY